MTHLRCAYRAGFVLTAIFAGVLAQAQEAELVNYAELQRLSRQAEARFFAEKMAALAAADKLGLPVWVSDPRTGAIRELMRLGSNGRPIYFETRNAEAAVAINAHKIYPGGSAGHSVTGAGTKVGLWDAGVVRGAHQEFEGRAAYFNAVTITTHATHAAGTIMAGGVGSPLVNGVPTDGAARGVAYEATLRSYDWNNAISELTTEYTTGNPVMLASNHPYGPTTGWAFGNFGAGNGWYWHGDTADSVVEDASFGRYETEAADYDALVFATRRAAMSWAVGNDRGEGPGAQPTGFYWNGSAWVSNPVARQTDGGNSGYDTISGAAVAKNVISVGAVENFSTYTGPSSVHIADYSAWGPTDDGRIKPDVVADGTSLVSSTAALNTSYEAQSGTSQASSSIAGALTLLHDFGWINGTAPPHAARGLLIHTARECGPHPGPDYMYGWGLVDIERVIHYARMHNFNQNRNNVEGGTFHPGGSPKKWYFATDGTKPVRVTLAWTDPAGTALNTGLDNTASRLKTDLDVKVARVGGATYFPWVLNPSVPDAAATTGVNTRDNVEVVDIPAPPGGLYEITVTGATVGVETSFSLITGVDYLETPVFGWMNGSYITGTNSTNALVILATPAQEGGQHFYTRVEPAGAVKVTNPIVIAQGTTEKSFPIVGGGDVAVNTPFTVYTWTQLTEGRFTGILIPLRMNALTVTPNPVQAGQSVSVTVKMNGPAPPGGKVITIDRSPTYWVMAPASVTIPQGQSQITFSVPIRAGAPAINNARITVTQGILPSGTVSLSKLFNIVP